MAEDILFKFQSLEITSTKLMISFYEEKIVVPLNDIGSYHLKWYLHDPIFGKKWWYLVLTVDLKDGGQESASVAVARFNYVTDEHELRQDVQAKITDAINMSLSNISNPPSSSSSAAVSK
jgi:hypothetical protein